MFNRYLYEKLEHNIQEKQQLASKIKIYSQKKKKQNQQEVKLYKAKVRNFLVQLASNPIQLGQYHPPIQTLSRSVTDNKLLGSPQMFINGFKTNKQRLQDVQMQNKMIDIEPTEYSPLNHTFRQRRMSKQIQPGMRFADSKSFSVDFRQKQNTLKFNSQSQQLKLPSLSLNPQKSQKTYFKALEQMGNSLKMMSQSQKQRTGLTNRLMTVFDNGKQLNLQNTTMDLLAKCKLLKAKRINSERTLKYTKSLQLTKY